jgi:hypothetical protein
MEWLIIISIIFLILAVSVEKATISKDYNYQQRKALFTPAERSFFGVLEQAITDKYRVLGKVRVADILTPAKNMNRKKWQTAFNRISSKHFDYVLCEKDTLSVIAVIELDDKSHKREKSIARDKLLNSACDSANLILIRFDVKARYQVQDIRNKINTVINSPRNK